MSVQSVTPLTDSLEAVVEEYRQWLAVERSLASVTVSYRAGVARRFDKPAGHHLITQLTSWRSPAPRPT